MTVRSKWMDRWIVITTPVQSKMISTSIDFNDVRLVEMDSKLVNGKLKRAVTFTFTDSSTYAIPDEATVNQAPMEYMELIAYLARQVKV